MNLELLKEPFAPEDVEWRAAQSGDKNGKCWVKVLAYITNRAIMNRLDDVCGMGGWRNEYVPAPLGGVMCGIYIKVDNEWIGKWDGADNTNIEATKGGLSGAMKRAGYQWGIGRYLYGLTEGWGTVSPHGKNSAKTKSGTWFKWDPPALPQWALPQKTTNSIPVFSNTSAAIIESPVTVESKDAKTISLDVNHTTATDKVADFKIKVEEAGLVMENCKTALKEEFKNCRSLNAIINDNYDKICNWITSGEMKKRSEDLLPF